MLRLPWVFQCEPLGDDAALGAENTHNTRPGVLALGFFISYVRSLIRCPQEESQLVFTFIDVLTVTRLVASQHVLPTGSTKAGVRKALCR